MDGRSHRRHEADGEVEGLIVQFNKANIDIVAQCRELEELFADFEQDRLFRIASLMLITRIASTVCYILVIFWRLMAASCGNRTKERTNYWCQLSGISVAIHRVNQWKENNLLKCLVPSADKMKFEATLFKRFCKRSKITLRMSNQFWPSDVKKAPRRL